MKLPLLILSAFMAQAAMAVNTMPLKPDSSNPAPATVFGSPSNGVSFGKTTAPSEIIDAVGNIKLTGNLTGQSSVTASGFFGSGAALSGVSGTDSSRVSKAGDTMTGELTNTSTITIQGNAFSVGGSTLVVSGGRVGVGTTSPLTFIHAKTGTTSGLQRAIKLEHGTPLTVGNGTYIEFAASTTDGYGPQIGGFRELAGGLGAIVIRTGGGSPVERMRVSNAGLVGIGSSAPASKLHLSSGVFTNDGTGAVPSGFALCYTASGAQGHCTSVVGAGGGCTCSSP